MKLLSMLFLSGMLFAQSLQVGRINRLNLNDRFYQPKFITGSEILLTGENYNGLYSYNINDEKLTIISGEAGAGYEAAVDSDKNIYFRSYKLNDGRKYYSLKKYNAGSRSTEILEENKRNVPAPKIADGEFVSRKYSNPAASSAVYITNENSLINLHKNGSVKTLKPFGDGVYVWAELSPDKSKISFTFGAEGSYIIDLSGNVVSELGKEVHYAQWSPDGRYLIYMNDKDDGRNYTSSDIWLYNLGTGERTRITNTPDKIEMYPAWSPDGKSAVFNDLEGNVYTVEFREAR